MIFQLRHPIGLLAVAAALVVGIFCHDAAQVGAAALFGDDSARRAGRLRAGLGSRLDAFGTIGGVLLGYGWAVPVQMNDRFRGRRKRVALAIAAGPLTYIALCIATTALIPLVDTSPQGYRFVLLAAYTSAAMFVVSILPLPPLDGGRIMLVLAPQTLGWQKARYQLVERNVGVAVALAILILPLITRIPSVVGTIAGDLWTPIGHAVSGLPGSVALGSSIGDYDVP